MNPARIAAFQILQKSRNKQAYASELIDQQLQQTNFIQADRGLLTQLVNGILRRRLTLDTLIKPFIRRDFDKVQEDVRDVLHIGTFQMACLTNIPHHAAVDESVELVGTFNPGAKGFVNGVLRRVSETVTEDRVDLPARGAFPLEDQIYRRLTRPLFPDPNHEPIEYLAEGFSWPYWLAERWFERFDWEESVRLGFWFLEVPGIWLRVNPLRIDPATYLQTLLEQRIDAEASDVPQSIRLWKSLPIPLLPGYEEGWFTVQDPSATQVAAALNPTPGSRVLDLCAAPGGKTTHLAEWMQNQGVIVACDMDADRLHTVNTLAKRLGITIIQTQLIDEQTLPEGLFDYALVDVPCSNTGVLARRPEVRWRITPKDLEYLVPLQIRLLKTAMERVQPNGVVVYSTCSIEPDENEVLVRSVLNQNPGWKLEEEHHSIPGQPADGSYWARLRRT